jgi:two-component system response regulator MprA
MGARLSASELILIADDDVRWARMLARMLREDGYDVEVTTDGAAAIGRLSRAPAPDVLVTDVQMPHADGVSVARFARTVCPGLCILVVTAYPEPVDLASSAIIARSMTKPIDYAVLLDAIRRRGAGRGVHDARGESGRRPS